MFIIIQCPHPIFDLNDFIAQNYWWLDGMSGVLRQWPVTKFDTTVGVGHSRRYCNTGYDWLISRTETFNTQVHWPWSFVHDHLSESWCLIIETDHTVWISVPMSDPMIRSSCGEFNVWYICLSICLIKCLILCLILCLVQCLILCLIICLILCLSLFLILCLNLSDLMSDPTSYLWSYVWFCLIVCLILHVIRVAPLRSFAR